MTKYDVGKGAEMIVREDKERERLEVEVRKQQMLAEQYKRESEDKDIEIEQLQDRLNASSSQDVVPQQV